MTHQKITVLRWRIARLIAWLWRFSTLSLTNRLLKRTTNSCILHRSFAGAQLYLDVSRSNVQGMLYLEGERFVVERYLLAQLVKNGMSIVDVGANIGYYTLLFKQLAGPTGGVLAIEPSPENLPELRLNIENNEFQNVKLLEVAIGAHAGTVSLLEGVNSGIVEPNKGSYEVPIRSLDELLTERVDLLKIDVEGYEGFVLEGARNVIERDRPLILLEFHPRAVEQLGHSFDSILALLAQNYNSISYYDVPSPSSSVKKFVCKYIGTDPCRRLVRAPTVPMHLGRENGTFWMVCQ